MDTDRNLLFGVLALQAGLIDQDQFVEACALWATRKSVLLPELLRERGWLIGADQEHLEYLLERRINQQGGNVHASLVAIPEDIKQSLAALQDDDIQRSLAGEPLTADAQLATMDHVLASKERYCRLRLRQHSCGPNDFPRFSHRPFRKQDVRPSTACISPFDRLRYLDLSLPNLFHGGTPHVARRYFQ
jgi:hypothetical protein